MGSDFIVDVLKERSRRVVLQGSEVGCVCPFCGGSRENPRKIQFFFNLDTERFHCFRCGKKGTGVRALLELLGLDPLDYVSLEDLLVPSSDKGKQRRKRPRPRRIWDIDRFCVREHPEIDKFVKERLFGRLDPNFELLYGIKGDGMVFRRIVIPVRNEQGEICIFSARATLPQQSPKYIIPPVGEFDERIPLLGYDLFDAVFVVEGAVDVLLGGPHFTCSFGSITQTKLEWISNQIPEGTRIIAIPDADEPGLKALLDVDPDRFNLSVFIPPVGKDLGEWIEKDKSVFKLWNSNQLIDYILAHTMSWDQFSLVWKIFLGG